jgi:hypothetical protein
MEPPPRSPAAARASSFDPTTLGLPASFRLTDYSRLKG